MDINQTPSTQDALEAAELLGKYFEAAPFTHTQGDEAKVIQAFAESCANTLEKDLRGGIRHAHMLTALAYLQEQIGHVIHDIVEDGRKTDRRVTWHVVGAALGTTRQRAQQKFK